MAFNPGWNMLEIRKIQKRYPNDFLALADFSLSVKQGEILVIVGGSGCGKSTLLRLIAGLDQPTAGSISLDGTPVLGPRPEIGVVFQEPRLMPWLTIAKNVAFGIRHLPAEEQRQRVAQVLKRVGLSSLAERWPKELSGGQAQRVALARALVGQPEVLLMDEPYSALDALTRHDLQEHLLSLWVDQQPTLILVTHDIEEALFLADQVVVLQSQPGRVKSSFPIHLERPRQREDTLFLQWRSRLLKELDHANRVPETSSGPVTRQHQTTAVG